MANTSAWSTTQSFTTTWGWGSLPRPSITYGLVTIDFSVPVVSYVLATIPKSKINKTVNGTIEIIGQGYTEEMKLILAPMTSTDAFLTALETWFTANAGRGAWFTFDSDESNTRKDGSWLMKPPYDWQPKDKQGLRYIEMNWYRKHQ